MTQFDADILLSLWKWKFLTTAAVTELHFSKLAPSYAHRRLLDLKKVRLVEWLEIPKENSGRAYAWVLTSKGFGAIRSDLPRLRQDGFRSECVKHDFICTAFHLGNWVSGIPEGCALFSEQELRRLHVGQYPKWVPQSLDHRPDGYWLTVNGSEQQVVAMEFERTPKTPSDYRETAVFYSVRPDLFRVVWLVGRKSIAAMIHEAVTETKGKGMRLHNFVLEKDFRKFGWDAKFFLGRDIGLPVSRLFPTVTTSSLHVGPTLLLNTLKSPHRSPAYAELEKTLKTHRLGSSLVPNPSSQTHNPHKENHET